MMMLDALPTPMRPAQTAEGDAARPAALVSVPALSDSDDQRATPQQRRSRRHRRKLAESLHSAHPLPPPRGRLAHPSRPAAALRSPLLRAAVDSTQADATTTLHNQAQLSLH